MIDVCNDGSEDILNVTIADLKSSKRNLPQRMTVSPVVSTEHKIPAILTKLGNGQRLKLTAIARKGIAREDPTWYHTLSLLRTHTHTHTLHILSLFF